MCANNELYRLLLVRQCNWCIIISLGSTPSLYQVWNAFRALEACVELNGGGDDGFWKSMATVLRLALSF
ncbi:predicted protein [Lichtheimia corymbifera JMRC:FSU:9682]|uniref:Uncharacterized protein n=1 Tax=Lichtheimia corymbifera JMRC:FSU:9682 TaxID=1263082 RepID=A0A068S1K2_9FUNG|nr:predicted protein [Lichtheimia corymbifera JMRC:FSU:9682]